MEEHRVPGFFSEDKHKFQIPVSKSFPRTMKTHLDIEQFDFWVTSALWVNQQL